MMQENKLVGEKAIFLKILICFISIVLFSFNTLSAEILFPRAFTVVTDDLGWMHGSSLGDIEGPWRAGIRRDFEVFDYKAMVNIGKKLNTRLLGVFILSELDRNNDCAKVPNSTMDGKNWDNSENISKKQIRIMDFVKKNAAYLEFGLHGVGHEHWENGKRTRAEWYDIDHNKPWSEKNLQEHIKLFKQIMAQYGLSEENGQSFPESFVPCAYSYYWNPDSDYSLGSVLNSAGVKYADTDFRWIEELNPPIKEGGGIDHGVLVQNRYNYGNPWYQLASLPKKKYDEYETDIIEAHFPNWLAQDYFLQDKLSKKWIEIFKDIQRSEKFYYSKNSEQQNSQWLYKKYCEVKEIEDGVVEIDNRKMPSEVYKYNLLGNMVLAVKLKEDQHVSTSSLNGKSIASYYEDEGYGFLYLPILKQKKYQLKYEIGNDIKSKCVYNSGTYNIYNFQNNKNETLIDMKMYGKQTVEIVNSNKPKRVVSTNKNLSVLDFSYNNDEKKLKIILQGLDIQGERGIIKIKY